MLVKKINIQNIKKSYIYLSLFILLCITLVLIVNIFFRKDLEYSINVNNNILDAGEFTSYLEEIDSTLFTTALNEQNEALKNRDFSILTNDYLISFGINYILKNYNEYSNKILTLEKNYLVNIDGESYVSNEYISVSNLISVINMFFDAPTLEYENNVFYDKSTGFFSLIGMLPSYIPTEKYTLISAVEKEGKYIVALEYLYDLANKTTSFKVKYILEKVFLATDKYKIVLRGFSVM